MFIDRYIIYYAIFIAFQKKKYKRLFKYSHEILSQN